MSTLKKLLVWVSFSSFLLPCLFTFSFSFGKLSKTKRKKLLRKVSKPKNVVYGSGSATQSEYGSNMRYLQKRKNTQKPFKKQ